jgi:hypothetical protein
MTFANIPPSATAEPATGKATLLQVFHQRANLLLQETEGALH